MLGAVHTTVLMKLAGLMGCESALLEMPAGLAMIFGNLIPDYIPVLGISPLVTHEMDRAEKLVGKNPPLGTGIMIHIYTDNLTHCDSVHHTGNYDASIAFRLGARLMERTEGEYSELVEKFSPRSSAYTLHAVIEHAADVLAARDDVIAMIEKSWAAFDPQAGNLFEEVIGIYDIDAGKIIEGLKNFPPHKRPPPEVLYSRRSRADLFMRRFTPANYDISQTDDDREKIIEMIEAGEELLQDKLALIMDDFSRRILNSDPALGDRMCSILEGQGN